MQIDNSKNLPDIGQYSPFKAVLAIEETMDGERRDKICDWLNGMGGKYVMVCGEDCQAWADAVRQANLRQVNIEEMQAEQFVMITVHHQERLRNVFWHAKKHARHTHVDLQHILVIHIGAQNRSVEYISIFDKA